MENRLKNALEDIVHQRIPEFAKTKKGFSSFFASFQKENLLSEMGKTLGQIDENGEGLRGAVEEIQKRKINIYKLDGKALEVNKYKWRPLSSGYTHQYMGWIMNLVSKDWHLGQRYVLLRQFIFYLAYNAFKSNNHSNELETLLPILPESHHTDVFMIFLLAAEKQQKSEKIPGLIKEGKKHSANLRSVFKEEEAWIYKWIGEKLGVMLGKELESNMQWLLEFEEELDHLKPTQENQRLAGLKITDLATGKKLEGWSRSRLLQLYKLARFVMRPTKYNRSFPKMWVKLHAYCLEKIDWQEDIVLDYINLLINMSFYEPLASPVQSYLEQFKEGKSISEKLYKKLWEYHLLMKSNQNQQQDGGDLLRSISTDYLVGQDDNTIWKRKLMSGFTPVTGVYPHNPYHGLHPSQIRPFFRLLRGVAEVDIIKFYRIKKIYHVRFIVQGEVFDMPTGDGFGMGYIDPLNTIIFEKGIPYQFVVLTLAPHQVGIPIGRQITSSQIITLINQSNYERFKDRILIQNIAGFAAATSPVPSFTKHLDEINPIKAKPNLDKIDLKHDSKFLTILGEIQKLVPIEKWTEIISYAMTCPVDKKPGKTWQNQMIKLIESLPENNYQNGMVLLLEAMLKSNEWIDDEEKLAGLRGFAFACRWHSNDNLLYLLQKVAERGYKKVPGGPLNTKLGNIALDGLSSIGTIKAFGILGNLKAKTKYTVFIRAINSNIKKFKKLLADYTPEQLQDQVIPDHELINGIRTMAIGPGKAIMVVAGSKVQVSWENANGKATKSVPAVLKNDYASEVKVAKSIAKSIEETIRAQAHRLEGSWLHQRNWAFADWQKFYLDHPLMTFLVKRLIWRGTHGEESIHFLPIESGFINEQGAPVEIPEGSKIELWHPAHAEVDEVLAWRNLLFEKQIQQPFKQAFREVYLLTPAEQTTFDHSNRFGGHYLRGNTLYSLGKTRGWTMTYDQAPLLKLPGGTMIAELMIKGGVLYSECTTKELYFKQVDPKQNVYSYYNAPKMPLEEVPPVLLSEVMRDVDLFVAVSGIGVDPYFDQQGEANMIGYWRDVSFGKKSKTPIAEVRKDLLNRLIPMTKIAKQCKIVGNYLEVEGKIRGYKINLGSGNILMKPNDQYLCIVPGNNRHIEKKIWLPFEGGDKTLVVILSKAFMLAEDDKITDSSILRQIK